MLSATLVHVVNEGKIYETDVYLNFVFFPLLTSQVTVN